MSAAPHSNPRQTKSSPRVFPAKSSKANGRPAHAPAVSSTQSVPTLGRRLLAWGLEVAILTTSIAAPVYLGHQLNQRTNAPEAELTPTLKTVQNTVARTLGLSQRSLPEQVPHLTNVLWSASLGLPLILAAAHVYGISRNGRSLPKRWAGVQVLSLNGQMPGLRRTLLREVVGKFGSPLVVAYGFWRLSGAFPVVGIFVGLGAIALVAESLTGLSNRPRRAWHDWIAGTCVVDQETGAIIRLSSLWDAESRGAGVLRGEASAWVGTQAGPTSVVMDPIGDRGRTKLTASRVGGGLLLLLALGGLAGVGSYFILGRAPVAATSTTEDSLYVTLVSTLTNPELDAAARRSAVLALGNLPDDRVTPLLVDLIAQTDDPHWLDALQQALVARGPEAFPYLRRLNRSLSADLAMQSEPTLRRTLTARLQTVNRVLAKLLLLEEGDRPNSLDLSRLNLGHLTGGNGDFRLVLRNQNLSGTEWQGSILTQAQLQGATFYSIGPDDYADTYDDRTADLSGANLTDANLVGANLSLARLVNAGLLRTRLDRADLTMADLSGANMEQASLVQAALPQARLVEARLSKADLTAAELTGANLEGARLGEINAAGAQLQGASLRGVAANAANFGDANFTDAALENADLTGARLQGSNAAGAVLTGASLRDADLRSIRLQGAVLEGADFGGAILTDEKTTSENGFVEAPPDLSSGNQFDGVDFSRVRNLDPGQLSFICIQGGIHPACDVPNQP